MDEPPRNAAPPGLDLTQEHITAAASSPPPTPWTIYAIMALNIAVFALTALQSSFWDTQAVLGDWGSLYAPAVWDGAWWRLLTSMFLHVGIIHLALNMWALHNLGAELEEIYGPGRLLLLYFGAGWVASLASLVFTGDSVGASGAIFGLAGAWMALALRRREYFKAFGNQILFVIVINLVIGMQLSSSIDNYAHVGGLCGGFLLGLVLSNRLPDFAPAPWRRVAVGGLLLLILALTPFAVALSKARLQPQFDQVVEQPATSPVRPGTRVAGHSTPVFAIMS